MKKILFAAFAVSLLTVGCQKTEVIHQVGPTDGALISFSTEMSKLTKSTPANEDTPDADAEGMFNLRAQEIRVWAYSDYDDPNTTNVNEMDQPYDGMSNLNLYYDKPANHTDTETDKGTWAPKKEYYWPSAGKNLRFFAVSGVDLGEDLSKQSKVGITIRKTTNDITIVDPTLTINGYTVAPSNPNTDLMVADFICTDKSINTKKQVIFNFRHALSKVQFMFKTEGSDADVYIQSLEVKEIYTVADLAVREDESTEVANDVKFVWDNYDSQQIFTDDYDTEIDDFTAIIDDIEKLNEDADDDNTVLKLAAQPEEFATWLVLPQDIVTKNTAGEITAGLKVEVIYVIGKRQFKAVFPLYVENTLERWDDNQYTKYLVTITPNKITFNAEAQEWKPYNSTTEKPNGDDINLQN